MVLCDDIAAMVAAAQEPQVAAGRAILCRSPGPPEASLMVAGLPRVSREVAAASNGLAVTWAELDEGYRKVACHAGAYILPALLAEAEAERHSLDDVLSALAIAYEVTVRIASAYRFGANPIHPHGCFGAIGAAAGLASLRSNDAAVFCDAITAAATMVAPGPFNHAYEGALVRNVWTSLAATAGFRAADFAPLGIAGLPTALEDVFVHGWNCTAHPEALTEGLGETWAVEENYHKAYACCQYAHSAIEASLELYRRVPSDSGRAIAAIEVETHPHGMSLDVVKPATVLAAKFSMPHILASVAVHGRADAEAFDTLSLTDAAVMPVRARVALSPLEPIEAWPNDRPARVRWRMEDGTCHEASVLSARGGVDLPFTDAEIRDKMCRLTSGGFPAFGGFIDAVLMPRRTPSPLLTELLAQAADPAPTAQKPVQRLVS